MSDNRKNTGDLGTAPVGRLLLRMAIPCITAQLINALYNIVDRIYIGRMPDGGTAALAGLGVAFPLLMIISAFAALIGMGGAALTSFWKETLLTIVENIPVLLLMLLPIPFTAMLLKKKRPFHVRRDWFRAAVICLAAIVQIVTLLSLRIGGTGDREA